MSFDILADIKPLILTAIPSINSNQITGEFTEDQSDGIAIAHVRSQSPIHTFGTQKAVIVKPSFRIDMRHESEAIMHQWWDYIKLALDGLTDYEVNGRKYLIFYQKGDIIDLGRDENRRHIHVLYFDTEVIHAY
jgi:hypothetical protein